MSQHAVEITGDTDYKAHTLGANQLGSMMLACAIQK
jgi:hypothetical protein